MKKYEFVTMIQNMGDINSMPNVLNAREVVLTLINGFLYVKPGKNTEEFYKAVRGCLDTVRGRGENMYISNNKHIPFNKCLRTSASLALMHCIKEHFDEEYFDFMLEKVDVKSVCSRKRKLHYNLDNKQTRELSDLLNLCKNIDNTFDLRSSVTSNDSFTQLMTNIIYYTDASTAYSYACMIINLNHTLHVNVFNPGNLEIETVADSLAS